MCEGAVLASSHLRRAFQIHLSEFMFGQNHQEGTKRYSLSTMPVLGSCNINCNFLVLLPLSRPGINLAY